MISCNLDVAKIVESAIFVLDFTRNRISAVIYLCFYQISIASLIELWHCIKKLCVTVRVQATVRLHLHCLSLQAMVVKYSLCSLV